MGSVTEFECLEWMTWSFELRISAKAALKSNTTRFLAITPLTWWVFDRESV